MNTGFPFDNIRECKACGLCDSRKNAVAGIGSVPAKVMLIGEAPGQEEDKIGEPFVGKAGRQLDSLLYQIGWDRNWCFVTNTVHCRPIRNAIPSPKQIAACSHWLDIELDLVRPEILVLMGATAIARILGHGAGTVEHLHGKPIIRDILGRRTIILPCYHPAAALHNSTLLRQIGEDFQVLWGLVNDRDISEFIVRDEYPNPVYRLADTKATVSQMIDEIKGSNECAVDVETVEQGTRLWSTQISTQPGTGWFLPISSDFIIQNGTVPLAKWSKTAQFIVHFYLNDINWLDIPDNQFRDTMVMAYLLGLPQGLKELASRLCGIDMVSYKEMVHPGQYKMSIDYLTEASKREWPDPPDLEETKWDNKQGRIITRIKKPHHISRKIKRILADSMDNLDVDPYDRWVKKIDELERAGVESILGRMPESNLADIKFEDAIQYATRDADATLRVKQKMDKFITKMGLDFVLHMDTGILPMVNEMMKNGMPVDVDYFRNLSTEFDARMRAKSTELAVVVGHPFNPNSSNQVAQVVYNELGFKPTAFTPTKLISTDDQELKKTGHPVAKGIIEYRRLSKIKGTYADNLAVLPIPDESGVNRIHTTIKTTRTETGRLSSADPVNLQNIPIRSTDGLRVREGFIAALSKVLLEGDYAQIEMCVQAHMAKCKGLIDLFLRGDDPHTSTASNIFGVSYENAKQKKYRYPAKTMNFGVIYLISGLGLSRQIAEYISDLLMMGSPVDIDAWDADTCDRYIAEWYKLYPEIRDYQMEMAAIARRYGYVRDMFGRIRYIPEVSSPVNSVQESGLRMAANMPIQATAQGIIKLAMVKLWKELPRTEWANDVEFNMQIHDSLVFGVTNDDKIINPYVSWMSHIMCNVVSLLVPVKVDFKIGPNWAEMKKLELNT